MDGEVQSLPWGIKPAVGKAGERGAGLSLPSHDLSLSFASSFRLERPLVKSLRARRGQAHGPAGPRALHKSPPSSQTTMTWATTCGPTCFKVRLQRPGWDHEHAWSREHWAQKAFGVSTLPGP